MCLSKAFAVCLASPMGLKEPKDRLFHAIFHAFLSPSPCISHTWSSFSISYFYTITHHPISSPPSSPFLSFPAGESLYIVVSSWIWKPHSEVNVREVWQQQSALIEGRIKTVRRCTSLWKGGPLHSVYCLWLGRRLSDGGPKLLLRLWLLGVLKFPLKVSLPSNYILRFISAFRQTASEAFGEGKKKGAEKLGSISLCYFL